MVKKRVAYSVDTKNKAVEMKLQGYTTKQVMQELNIKNETQVKTWFRWYKNGETHTGYVTALYPEQLVLNFQSKTKHCKKVNARKCRLLWRFNKIYWLEQCI